MMMNMSLKIVLLVMFEVILTFKIFWAFALLIKVLRTKLLVNRKHLSDVSDTEEDINDINKNVTPDTESLNNHWTFKYVNIRNARVGIDMSSISNSVQSTNIGSLLLVESAIFDTVTGVLLRNNRRPNEESRAQYEQLKSDDIVSVKAGGARGDGSTDDSDAVQAVTNANVNNGKVVYFPSGTFVFFKTVTVPRGVKIIDEVWPVITAGGDFTFQDTNNLQTVLQVGESGQTGDVKHTDIMFSPKGAISLQWHIRQGSQGYAGMWDTHFRFGGSDYSNLQIPQYSRGQGAVSQCNGVHTILQITTSGSRYFEIVWVWIADHDLDIKGQIYVYTVRGVLIESTEGPVWLYGIQLEPKFLYQYQLTNARSAFMTLTQSETPYCQLGPPSHQPYPPNPVFNDPTYSHCLDTEDCHTSMVDLEKNFALCTYNINTNAATNMVVQDNTKVLAISNDNSNGFYQTSNAFLDAEDIIQEINPRISRIPIRTPKLKEIIIKRFERRKQLRESQSRIPVRTAELTKIILNRMLQLKDIRRNTKLLEKKFKKTKDMRLLCWLNQLYDDGETLLRQHNHMLKLIGKSE